jgi:CRISPR/Cas system-associated exonuclease Cas4 (RecB family)
VWWQKHDPLPDTGSWGWAERGRMVESWVVERLRAAHVPIQHEQLTLIDGSLSATIDLVIRRIDVEIKSYDPRKYKNIRQHRHDMQVQAQLGLLGASEGVLVYVNCSNLQEIHEFPVLADAVTYEALQRRADRIMSETDPRELLPEGRIAGGKECERCPYQERCKET